MTYLAHKIAARIAGVFGIAVVTMQCVGNGIRDWQLSPILLFIWVSTPAMLSWYFFGITRPPKPEQLRDNPYWAAVGEDQNKLGVILAVMIMLEFVFKP